MSHRLHEFRLRVKHRGRKAYWDATVIAPGALVAALFMQRHCGIPDMPMIERKNGRRYHARTGNRAYYRAVRLSLADGERRKELNLTPEQEMEIREKDAEAKAEAKQGFRECELVWEDPYVPA